MNLFHFFFLILFSFINTEATKPKAPCLFHDSRKCKSLEGFITEEVQGCASVSGNCRHVFCKENCLEPQDGMEKYCIEKCIKVPEALGRFRSAARLRMIQQNIKKNPHTAIQDEQAARTYRNKRPLRIKKSRDNTLKLETVSGEFEALTQRDFLQNKKGGACVLYSFLYAALQSPYLREKLVQLVKKDRDAYYIGMSTPIKISFNALQKLEADMHPSSRRLLRALGVFAKTKRSIILNGFEGFEEYSLVDDGVPPKDFFFELPVKSISVRKSAPQDPTTATAFLVHDNLIQELSTSKKSSLSLDNMKYSGSFVLSIATPGHAISAFYDMTAKRWRIFDNQKGILNPETLKSHVITGITLIGDFNETEIQPDKKLKRKSQP